MVWLVALMAVVSAGGWAYYARSRSQPAPTIATSAVTRGDVIDAITCQLDALGNRSWDVCVVPHSDGSSSMVQHFDAPGGALLRHAQIARQLRDSGWVLVDRVVRGRPAAA